MQKLVNDHALKLSGRVSIPEPLEMGANYRADIQGTITTITESDNHDGTISRYYKFEPILVSVIDEKGKTLKARDPRKMSQKWRALVKWHWESSESEMDEEEHYNKVMNWIMANGKEVISRALTSE